MTATVAEADLGCSDSNLRFAADTCITAPAGNNAEIKEEPQTAEFRTNDSTPVPKSVLTAQIWNPAWLIMGILALMSWGVGLFMKGLKSARSDRLVVHSLVAMSQVVATDDGYIDAAEVEQISHIISRLTGKVYAPEQIAEMLRKLNPSQADLAQVGNDLSAADRQIVLEAALSIAVASGEIKAREYVVVSDLAHHLRIGADPFRSALARISVHLDLLPSAREPLNL